MSKIAYITIILASVVGFFNAWLVNQLFDLSSVFQLLAGVLVSFGFLFLMWLVIFVIVSLMTSGHNSVGFTLFLLLALLSSVSYIPSCAVVFSAYYLGGSFTVITLTEFAVILVLCLGYFYQGRWLQNKV